MISFSNIFGFLLAIGLICGSIMMTTDNYLLFVSISSLIIVVGGSFAASLVGYSFPLVFSALKGILQNLVLEANDMKTKHMSIRRMTEWNNTFHSGGITELENSLTEKEKKDSFIKLGIDLIGTGYKGEELQALLEESNESQSMQDMRHAEVLNTLGNFAPGFGMVGTLIGLIVMLDNLGGDMTALGQGLAVALLTTFYGVIVAQLFFKPASMRVQRRVEMEAHRREMQIRAFMMMTNKRPSLHVQDHMNGYLPFNKRLED